MFVIEIAPATGSGQDRARVLETADGLVIALADGAGGTVKGAAAAEVIIGAIDRTTDAEQLDVERAGGQSSAVAIDHATDACALIEQLDGELAGGQSTAVVLVAGATITGASVGDSAAWLIRDDEIVELTHAQRRKPLVGDGCIAVAIEPVPFEGTLLVASDGLWSYAKRADIARIVRGNDLAAAARALVELVRLPSGQLPDDVSVILASRPSR